jgi:hypothetical protein
MQTRIEVLHLFQQDLLDATPVAIEQQRLVLEEYYNVKLVLTRPGSSGAWEDLRAPFVQGTPASMLLPLIRQVEEDRAGWLQTLQDIELGEGAQEWTEWTELMTLEVALRQGAYHYALVTQQVELEHTPDESQRLLHFSVLAAAARPGPEPGRRSLPGLFRDGVGEHDTITALAQAETFNRLDADPDGGDTVPWRVSTADGANWQARLMPITGLLPALDSDFTLRQIMADAGVGAEQYNAAHQLSAH